jgi:hypothetical protein
MFCTYVTLYRGAKLPPFYIGHSTTEKVALGYGGSVSSRAYRDIWKAERKARPELFRTRILSTHSTREAAVEREVFLQRAMCVTQNPLYTNAAIATGRPSLRGVKKSKEHCRNLSLAKRGKTGHKPGPRSEAWKEKQRSANLGKKASPETKAKMAEARKGRKHSPETLAKMRATYAARRAT